VGVNERDDLVAVEGKFKISGSSAKLGENSAYHHCTLLINVDLQVDAMIRQTLNG
jgi:lipoyltransferase 1